MDVFYFHPSPFPNLPYSRLPCLCYKGIVSLGGNVHLPSFLRWHASLKEWRPYLIHNPRWLHKHTTSHQLGNTEMLLKINELIIKYIFFSCNNQSYRCGCNVGALNDFYKALDGLYKQGPFFKKKKNHIYQTPHCSSTWPIQVPVLLKIYCSYVNCSLSDHILDHYFAN